MINKNMITTIKQYKKKIFENYSDDFFTYNKNFTNKGMLDYSIMDYHTGEGIVFYYDKNNNNFLRLDQVINYKENIDAFIRISILESPTYHFTWVIKTETEFLTKGSGSLQSFISDIKKYVTDKISDKDYDKLYEPYLFKSK